MPGPPANNRSVYPLLAVGLLAACALLLLDSVRQNFVTLNEFGHVPAGLSHWQTGTFSLYRVNPPLPRMLAVVPVLLDRPTADYHRLRDAPGTRAEWQVGQDFMRANAPRYFRLVQLARYSGLLWWLVGAWLVYRWAGQLYGRAAGCLGLALWCLCPTLLAFAPLVVPDVPAAVAALAAGYTFWLYGRQPSWQRAALAGLLLGIALLTKFTLLVLYAVWPLLCLLYRWDHKKHGGAPWTFSREGVQGLVIAAVSLAVVHLGYGFDQSFRPLKDYAFVSPSLAGTVPASNPDAPYAPANRCRGTWLGRLPVPVPAQYLRGIDAQMADIQGGFPSYLRGELRHPGWWYYYLYALAVKVPLGFWALVLWGVGLTMLRCRTSARWADECSLWLPAAAVLALVSSQTGYNHHLRYVLPMFPFVIVSTAKLGCFLQRGQRLAPLLLLGLLLWGAGSSLRVHPHYLAYFNELAGGPANGHRHLINSNLDWGQDLLRLKEWLDAHPEARPLGFACYHFVDPRLVGIDFHLPPLGPVAKPPAGPPSLWQAGPQPGYYAVSVNLLHGLDFVVPAGQGGGQYIPRHAYEYFGRWQPLARAGYSIFIYHVTVEEANAARKELGWPPLRQ